jgi:hypothetical protein
MPEPGTPTTASLVVKLGTSPKTAHNDREEGKEELRLTLLTLTLKRTCFIKEAKLKGAE